MRSLKTARLVLEPQAVVHAEEMFAVLADPALYLFENAPPDSVDTLSRRFARLARRQSPDGTETWLNWVVRIDAGPLIGFVQATLWSRDRARIAYVFGSTWWGQGYAHEAVVAMLDELRDTYGVAHVAAVYKRKNEPSRKLLERLGFAPRPLLFGDKEALLDDEDAMYAPGHRESGPQ